MPINKRAGILPAVRVLMLWPPPGLRRTQRNRALKILKIVVDSNGNQNENTNDISVIYRTSGQKSGYPFERKVAS